MVKVSSCALPAHPLLLCSESLAAFVNVVVSLFLRFYCGFPLLAEVNRCQTGHPCSARDQHEGMLVLRRSFSSVTVLSLFALFQAEDAEPSVRSSKHCSTRALR